MWYLIARNGVIPQDAKARGVADDDEELINLRYQRYLFKAEKAEGTPLSIDEWMVKERIMRTNRNTGRTAEDGALSALDLDNNNLLQGSSRTYYIDDVHGGTVPDAVTDKFWVEVKSLNGSKTTQYYSEQLKAQVKGARAQGKQSVVILTGDNPAALRPSENLALESNVFRFDQATEEWRAWNNTSGTWEQTPLKLDKVKKIIGTSISR